MDEIQLQTDLIDMKKGGVDVYDLDTQRVKESVVRKSIGIKKVQDACTGTEPTNKKLISTRDWFYSELHRRIFK